MTLNGRNASSTEASNWVEVINQHSPKGTLQNSADLFQAIVETLPEGVIIADLQSLVLYLNPMMMDLLGLPSSEVLGYPLHRVLPTSQGWLDYRPGQGHSRLDVCEFYEAELARPFHPSKTSLQVKVQKSPLFNQRGDVMAILIRVSPQSLSPNPEVKGLGSGIVHIDALTGLPNRPLFMERLEKAILRAQRDPHYWFAVLFLDLDRFKVINDSLGHLAGDQLLITIARRLESCLRPTDTVARLGGDEFTILVDEILDVTDATVIADRIHGELAKPFNLDGHEVFTSVSIGIALGRESMTGQAYPSSEDLIRNADLAMYQSKSIGRAGHQVFDIAMHVRVVEQLELENSLRRAVERQEFCLLYQPIISLDTGRVSGFEALVRWQHPRRGQVLPEEFIPTAEETGLINRLGHWVLKQACRQMRVWQRRFSVYPPLTIGVNLSSKQLAQPDLIDQITQILEETQLEPNSLKLEITESMIMQNPEAATVLLEQLRSRNIQLCIDDFGTGYSSLSHLRRFPINTLKIDRSFISKMHADEENLAIVKTIVTLAHTLGIYITAEGVESNEQLVQLWALQCEYGQGYFFSKPLTAKAATALLSSSPQW